MHPSNGNNDKQNQVNCQVAVAGRVKKSIYIKEEPIKTVALSTKYKCKYNMNFLKIFYLHPKNVFIELWLWLAVGNWKRKCVF